MLLLAKADVNARNAYNQTALYFANKEVETDIARLLRMAGATEQ